MITEFLTEWLYIPIAQAQWYGFPTATEPISSTTLQLFGIRIRNEGFDGLQLILPIIFGAGITVGLAILVYRWIKGMISRPR